MSAPMHANPLHWRAFLGRIGNADAETREWWPRGDGQAEAPAAGVPVLGDPCPTEVRVPLRAVLRQAFLAGNREAPLVDALADVVGWEDAKTGVVSSVSIVVPIRGAHDALRLCLACLYAHTPMLTQWGTGPYKAAGLVAVFPEDEGAAVNEAWQAAVPADASTETYMDRTPAPQSFAANCNLGASRSRSEFVVLLNSDAFVGPGWLDALLAPFADPEVVAVGPMGTNVSGHQQTGEFVNRLAASRVDGAPLDVLGVKCATGAYAREFGGVHPPYLARRLVGFCMAIRRSAWNRVGGLDERFVNAFCDDDLSLRLSLVGKCVVVPDLLVLHAGSASIREVDPNYLLTLHNMSDRFGGKWGWLREDWKAWMDAEGWR